MGEMSPKQFGKFIVEWFAENKRDFPWRAPEVQRDPYKVWISEVMLQQTQAGRVVDFFVKFMTRFPDVSSLSRASWEDVLECVRGLGYYRRFRNLIRAAQMVVSEFGGEFPREYALLRQLPGVGEYTASAILVFAGGGTTPNGVPLDTNVRKVLKKFFPKGCSAIGQELSDLELKKIAIKACPFGKGREFYQGMMDYSARMKIVAGKRVKSSSAVREKGGLRLPFVRVAAGVIWRKNDQSVEVLIQTRTDSGNQIFEFPGGKIEPRETERACLKRELMEELGIEAAVRPAFLKTEFVFDNRVIRFSWHKCQILLGEPLGREGQEVKWVEVSELADFPFPPSNDEVLRELTS